MKISLLILLCTGVFFSCKTVQHMPSSENIISHPIRLKPGEDLRTAIEKYVKENNIEAGWIVTCAGSLTEYNIRFADQPNGSTGKGKFEIVSLTGTVSANGSHMHISISDSEGKMIGGHLLAGCTILYHGRDHHPKQL